MTCAFLLLLRMVVVDKRKDEEGFPIFDPAKLDEWRKRYKEES